VFAGSANLTFNGTTLTAANTSITTSETLSYGTANGVTYLNGSKVLTSGSALVFDGTNLGVGVTPSAWGSGSNAVQNTAGSVWRYGTDYIYLGQNYYFNGTNRIYSTTAAATEYRQGLGSHIFYTAPSGTAGNTISFTDRLTITSTGAVIDGLISASTTGKVGTTLGVGGATPSASGSGITFPATQSASSNANTLDDYEEGTWTPTLTDGTNTTTSVANYRKIGGLVFVSCQFYNKDISGWGASAGLSITGLPFSSSVNHDIAILVSIPNTSTSTGPFVTLIGNAVSTMGLYKGGGSVNYVALTRSDFSNNSTFSVTISGCYTSS
jgi:hypothetical protein